MKDPNMEDDEIMKEMRAAKEAYAASFNYDIHAILRHAREQTRKQEREGRIRIWKPNRPTSSSDKSE